MSFWSFVCFLFSPALCLTKAPIVPDRISIWWKLKAGVALLLPLRGVAGLFFFFSYFCGPVLRAWFIESCHPAFWLVLLLGANPNLFSFFIYIYIYGWVIHSVCSPHPSARWSLIQKIIHFPDSNLLLTSYASYKCVSVRLKRPEKNFNHPQILISKWL